MSKENPELNDVFIGYGSELWFVKAILDNDPWNGRPKKTLVLADPYKLNVDRYLTPESLQEFLKIKMMKWGWSAKEAKKWKE